LRASSFAPGDHSTHGLALNGSALVYSIDDKFKQFTGTTESSVVVMRDLNDDTDPSPLLLVYTDDDSPDEQHRNHYRQVLLQRLVAILVCDANLLPVEQPYAITARELCIKATDGTFQYLAGDKQTCMERFIRVNIFGRIAKFWKEKPSPPVKVENQSLLINYKDKLAKVEFVDWLEDAKRTNFTDEKVDERQILLFSDESLAPSATPTGAK